MGKRYLCSRFERFQHRYRNSCSRHDNRWRKTRRHNLGLSRSWRTLKWPRESVFWSILSSEQIWADQREKNNELIIQLTRRKAFGLVRAKSAWSRRWTRMEVIFRCLNKCEASKAFAGWAQWLCEWVPFQWSAFSLLIYQNLIFAKVYGTSSGFMIVLANKTTTQQCKL